MAEDRQLNNVGLWGALATAVGSVANTVITNTPKARANNLAIAEANARAAEANATAGGAQQPMNTKLIAGIGIGVVVLVLLVVMLGRNNQNKQ